MFGTGAPLVFNALTIPHQALPDDLKGVIQILSSTITIFALLGTLVNITEPVPSDVWVGTVTVFTNPSKSGVRSDKFVFIGIMLV